MSRSCLVCWYFLCSLLLVCRCDQVPVFVHGEGGYPCIRIPAVTRCGEESSFIHAFAECRTRTGDGCVPSAAVPKANDTLAAVHSGGEASSSSSSRSSATPLASVCYKRSADDGSTWSELRPLAYQANQPTVVCDQTMGNLLLQFNANGSNWQIASHDQGLTWGSPQEVDLGKYKGTSVGPGRGLQLSHTSPHHPDRLLFIGHHGAYEFDVVWFSDDHGATYNVSGTVLEKMDEAQLVQLKGGGAVMANMRNSHLDSCQCRAVSLSQDGGDTFSKITYDPTLISPVCMATIISSANGSLIFANPASKTQRSHGLVRRSDDGGTTWPHGYPITTSSGAFAYSCLTEVEDEREVGLLWETEAAGCSGPSCQMVFSKIKLY